MAILASLLSKRSALKMTPLYLGVVSGYLIGTAGALALLFQGIHWLRHGEWQPVSVVTALAWSGLQWASYPADWIGMHKFLTIVRLSLCFFVMGGIVHSVALIKVESVDDDREQKKK